MHARLRPLARYQTQDAHEAWVGGLLLEGRLRARIQVRLIRVWLGLGRIRQPGCARGFCGWAAAGGSPVRAPCMSAHTAALCLWRSSTRRRVAWVCARWLCEPQYSAHIKLCTLHADALPHTHRDTCPFLVHEPRICSAQAGARCFRPLTAMPNPYQQTRAATLMQMPHPEPPSGLLLWCRS